MSQTAPIAKGQDYTIKVRVLAGDGRGEPIKIRLTAPAASGATSLTIRGDHPAIASGDKFLFGEEMVVSASATCAAGVQTLSVTAIAAPLRQGDELAKIQDLTGATIAMEILTRRGDATALIAKSGGSITIATQTGDDRGFVSIAGVAADTASMDPGSYYGAVWRSNSGSARPLCEFTLQLREAGFL